MNRELKKFQDIIANVSIIWVYSYNWKSIFFSFLLLGKSNFYSFAQNVIFNKKFY